MIITGPPTLNVTLQCKTDLYQYIGVLLSDDSTTSDRAIPHGNSRVGFHCICPFAHYADQCWQVVAGLVEHPVAAHRIVRYAHAVVRWFIILVKAFQAALV